VASLLADRGQLKHTSCFSEGARYGVNARHAGDSRRQLGRRSEPSVFYFRAFGRIVQKDAGAGSEFGRLEENAPARATLVTP
jgi:hypothetical protein